MTLSIVNNLQCDKIETSQFFNDNYNPPLLFVFPGLGFGVLLGVDTGFDAGELEDGAFLVGVGLGVRVGVLGSDVLIVGTAVGFLVGGTTEPLTSSLLLFTGSCETEIG